MHTLTSLLKDLDQLDHSVQWLFDLQGRYGAEHWYASDPEHVLTDDMKMMRFLIEGEVGKVVIRDHRAALDRLTKKEKA